MALVAAYAFDEGTGTTAAEASGGTTLTGVPAWDTGLHDDAMRLNLVNGPIADPFGSSTAFTIMFDVYIVGAGNGNYNLFIDGTIGEIGIIQQGGGNTLEWYPWFGPTGTAIADATWTHVAVVADGTNRRIVVNGTQVATTSNTELSGTNPFTLGGESGFEPNIRLDNLRIYDTGLTNPEIAALAGTAVTSSGTAYDKTPADAAGITDARTVVQDATRSQGDSVGLSDAVAVVVTSVRTTADPVGISDTDSPLVLEIGETLDDALGLTDSVTFIQTRIATISDPVGIADEATPAGEGDEVATPSDPVAATDDVAFILDGIRAASDAVGLLDSASAVALATRAPADQLALTDSAVAVLEHVVTIADTIAMTDLIGDRPTYRLTVSAAPPAHTVATAPAAHTVTTAPAAHTARSAP